MHKLTSKLYFTVHSPACDKLGSLLNLLSKVLNKVNVSI